MLIERATDAEFINDILNHPAVRPWVADASEGVLDVSSIAGNAANYCLVGDYGTCLFVQYYEGAYEVHTAIVPEGRGEWAKNFAEAVLHYMFTATDAIEILTRVPQGHIAAKALTEAVGFHHHFTTAPECLFRGQKVPCHIYMLALQDWAMRAPDMAEKGADFHDWLNASVKGAPHEVDPAHNRVVGVALDMLVAGRTRKALVWYNRWSVAARHAPVRLLEDSPPQIMFDAGILTLRDGQFHLEVKH